jgi:hypothetical protein
LLFAEDKEGLAGTEDEQCEMVNRKQISGGGLAGAEATYSSRLGARFSNRKN